MAKIKAIFEKVFLPLLFLGIFIFYRANMLEAKDMKEIALSKPKLKGSMSLEETILKRRSVRSYSSKKISTENLSQLLWAAQGVTDTRGLRAAPSAGALYPLEIYAVTEEGVYHYVPETHTLLEISSQNVKPALTKASWGQNFVNTAPLDIIITAVYSRVSGRYGKRGIRYTDMEAGHVAEHIPLHAVALGLSSVPVGAFDDANVSRILNLPKEEKPLYIIPVGYKK